MELKIENKQENSLLHRVEVSGTITFDDATPSNSTVQSDLAKKLSLDEKNIIIKQRRIKIEKFVF